MDSTGSAPWADIARLALAARDRSELRGELLRQATRWAGGDGGFIQRLAPDHEAPAEGTFHELDLSLVRRCHEGRHTIYATELRRLAGQLMTDAVVVDTHLFDSRFRARSPFYNEIMAQHGAREAMMGAIFGTCGEVTGICVMHRSRSATPFTGHALGVFRSLLPVIELADRFFARRQHQAATDVTIAGLSKREREIVELLALGYTNAEIALALGSSVFTVRNQLVAIYRKAGVSRRAELAALVGLRPLPS